MKKRGVSEVIATVLLILITIAAFIILWLFLLPMIKDFFSYTFIVDMKILDEGHTLWSDSNRLAKVQVWRGVDDAVLIGYDLIFYFNDTSATHFINESPGKNTKRVHCVNLAGYQGSLQKIKLAPVFERGKRGDAVSELNIRRSNLATLIDDGNCEVIHSGEPCEVTSTTHSFSCYEGDVWWFDNCGTRTSLKDSCGADETCVGGTCASVLDCSPLNNCFYVSVSGAGAHDGTLGNEFSFSESVAYANFNLHTNIKFLLREGNYGGFNFASSVSRTGSLLYKSEEDKKASFDKISIGSSSGNLIKYNLFIEDIKVMVDPSVKPSPTGYWINGYNFGGSRNAENVIIKNSYFRGFDKYVVRGFYITDSFNVSLIGNEAKTLRGEFPMVQSSRRVSIINNTLSELVHDSIFRIYPQSEGALISGNKVSNCNHNLDDEYFPTHTQGTTAWHPGSVFSMRSDDFVIEKNIVHDCHISQTIKTYDDTGLKKYSNITIQNNLFYDTPKHQLWNFEPSYERPIIIRNNTFIRRIHFDSLAVPHGIRQRYSDGFGLAYFQNNLEGFYFHNNLGNSHWPLPSLDNPDWKMTQSNNVLWMYEPFYEDGYRAGTMEFNKTIFGIWLTPYGASYSLRGYPNFFEDIGFSGSTPEYNYGTDGFSPMFVNPGFRSEDAGRYDLDYHPLINSVICNGGYLYGERFISDAVVGIPYAGALPCVCTEDGQCEEVYGEDSKCNLSKSKCE